MNETEFVIDKQELLGGNRRKFQLCIANLPFEPTPPGASNYLHSDGGEYGDKLIFQLIPKLEKSLVSNGVAMVFAFSLFKNGRSRLEEFVQTKELGLRSCIVRLSGPINLKILGSRFSTGSSSYKYLQNSYDQFVIEVLFAKKEDGGYVGTIDAKIANERWILPAGSNGIGKPV